MGEIQRIIIISIGGILLLTFIGVTVYQKYFTIGEIEVCRFSALAQATAKTVTLPGGSPFNLECKRRFVNIEQDHATMEYDTPMPKKPLQIITRGSKVKKYPAPTNDIINGIIAEEMKTCWYQFGEGKTDVFQNKWFAGDTVCFICSEVSFDEKIQPQQYTGLLEYLHTVDYPLGSKSYFDYFAETKNLDDLTTYINKDKKTYDLINATNTYYVLFVKDTTFFTFKTGTDKNSYLVLLFTPDQIDDRCSNMAG